MLLIKESSCKSRPDFRGAAVRGPTTQPLLVDRPLRPGVSMEGVGSVWPAFLDTGGGRLWRAGSPAGEPPVLTVTWGVGPLTGGSAPLLSPAVAVEHTARARSRCNASSAPSSEPQWPRLRAPRRRLRWPPRPPGRFPAWVLLPP